MVNAVNEAFTKALPKAELHAHLSGSISRETLHAIWELKQSQNQCLAVEDPATALKPAGIYPTVLSFFRIFNEHIYQLVDDRESIRYATKAVLADFERDGVTYLELRTTPRKVASQEISRVQYVDIVMEALQQYSLRSIEDCAGQPKLVTNLILSVDRSMSLAEASEVVNIAASYGPNSSYRASQSDPNMPYVVGIDLCGNPTKGNVSLFTLAFSEARRQGLRITVHFAEVPASSTNAELDTLLSWGPDRLGHAIHIPPAHKEVIKERRLGLELCLSCNVLAKLTMGDFADHHFGEWRRSDCAIALGTDDVGVFDSPLSNEYLLAARHFGFGRRQIVELARSAVDAAWAGRERMNELLNHFEHSTDMFP